MDLATACVNSLCQQLVSVHFGNMSNHDCWCVPPDRKGAGSQVVAASNRESVRLAVASFVLVWNVNEYCVECYDIYSIHSQYTVSYKSCVLRAFKHKVNLSSWRTHARPRCWTCPHCMRPHAHASVRPKFPPTRSSLSSHQSSILNPINRFKTVDSFGLRRVEEEHMYLIFSFWIEL